MRLLVAAALAADPLLMSGDELAGYAAGQLQRARNACVGGAIPLSLYGVGAGLYVLLIIGTVIL